MSETATCWLPLLSVPKVCSLTSLWGFQFVYTSLRHCVNVNDLLQIRISSPSLITSPFFIFFLFKNEHEHTFHISILIARVEIYFLQCKFAYRKTNVCPPFLICSKLSLCILWQQKRRIKLHQFFTAPVGFSWIILNRSDEPNASWFGSNKTFLVYKFELLVLDHFNASYLNS